MLVLATASCAASEYTTQAAQADLVKLGYTPKQAQCVIAGLRQRYADEYVKLNNLKKVDRVNPDAVSLYVRNKFAAQERIGNDEASRARAVVAGCRK